MQQGSHEESIIIFFFKQSRQFKNRNIYDILEKFCAMMSEKNW